MGAQQRANAAAVHGDAGPADRFEDRAGVPDAGGLGRVARDRRDREEVEILG
jgi:hypothetical protein